MTSTSRGDIRTSAKRRFSEGIAGAIPAREREDPAPREWEESSARRDWHLPDGPGFEPPSEKLSSRRGEGRASTSIKKGCGIP